MAASDNTRPPAALPPGTRLDEFELRRVLGIGGFGIVYLAFDHALEREVAIKEYMPASLVGRSEGTKLILHSESHGDSFTLGLRSFVNEARLLARFDAPGLVKVHRYWEANNTAYMAMPFYIGSNLHAVRRRMDGPPDEAWLRGILQPLLGALERLHREGIYHRDISPDNVILQPDGQPVLLDFGAARRVLTDKSVALTAILKPAYAPIEQYAEAGAVKQGAWTDLYALGATLHFLLLGRAPPPATTRAVDDEMQPLARQPALLARCTPGFLQALDWMLKPRPAERPQSVAALRAALQPQPIPTEDDDRTIIDLSRLPPSPGPTASPTPAPFLFDDDATVLLPRRDEPTVLIPRKTVPAPPPGGEEPTIFMPRHNEERTILMPRRPEPPAPGPQRDEPTILMPRRDDEPTVLLPPRRDEVNVLLPLDDEATIAMPRRGAHADHEPTLRMPPPGSPKSPPPPLQARREMPLPPTAPSRRPLLVAGLVLALGAGALAAWLALKPAAPQAGGAGLPGQPASAPGDAASTSAAPASTNLSAAPTTPAGTDAAPVLPQGQAKAARPAGAGVATASTRTPAPAAEAPAPAAAATTNATTGGPPGLATSITRLPPAAEAPTATHAGPAPNSSLPATSVAAAAAPAAQQVLAAVRGLDTPVPRAAARDSEPVQLQTRALSPAERCEGRGQQALAGCIERICRSETGLREHADCSRARREASTQ